MGVGDKIHAWPSVVGAAPQVCSLGDTDLFIGHPFEPYWG